MSALIQKYLNPDSVTKIVRDNNYDDFTSNEFYKFLISSLDEIEKYGQTNDDTEESILEDTFKFIEGFLAERRKGFSDEWAIAYATNEFIEGNDESPALAYNAVFKISQEQALKDLLHYSLLLNQDEHFVRHFAHLLKIDAPNVEPSVRVQAISYSRIYKEQLKKGESETFANKYAGLIAQNEYSQLGCYAEAREYEKALSAGYSQNYASAFADSISSYIANYCSNYEEALEDELVNLERIKLEKQYGHLKSS